MSKTGGYLIVDLAKTDIILGEYFTGLYNKLANTHKSVLLSGLVIDGTEYRDTPVAFKYDEDNGVYTGTVYGYDISVDEYDEVTATEHQEGGGGEGIVEIDCGGVKFDADFKEIDEAEMAKLVEVRTAGQPFILKNFTISKNALYTFLYYQNGEYVPEPSSTIISRFFANGGFGSIASDNRMFFVSKEAGTYAKSYHEFPVTFHEQYTTYVWGKYEISLSDNYLKLTGYFVGVKPNN